MVQSTPTGRSRGRRGGGADTKAALLAAAKTVFAEQGYDNATVRGIAARADVDPAMVNHWFGGKQGLFAAAVLHLPITPSDLLTRLLADEPVSIAERMVRQFVTLWDNEGGARLAALIRSVTEQPAAARLIREAFVERVIGPLVAGLHVDNPALRANLCGTQLIGLGVGRYVLRLEPLASADLDTLVAAIAPTFQRYLTGDISGFSDSSGSGGSSGSVVGE